MGVGRGGEVRTSGEGQSGVFAAANWWDGSCGRELDEGEREEGHAQDESA